jgi:hypothetical protein
MNPATVEHPYIHINGNSGYSRHGDTVSLFADSIDNANSMNVPSDNLALQLWACQSPYKGGDLAGWKLAEFQLGPLQANHYLPSIKSDVQASFPESGDYAIALVIAEWDGEGFNRIHDFHNYPNRDMFLHPRLEGSVGFHCVDEQRVVIDVGRIYNPRNLDNLSGTLVLELWALPEPYDGGTFEGHALACITLGPLTGGESWQDCVYDLKMDLPSAGRYTLTLMLREWVGNGYVTRDHTNFEYPVTFPIDTLEPETSEILEVDTALAQVASSGQSTDQKSATTLDEDVADTEHLVEPSKPEHTQQASELTEADSAEDQVVQSGGSTGQNSETTLVEDVADTENPAEPLQLNDAQQASEMMEGAMAQAQAVPSEQLTGRASETSVVEDVTDAEPRAGRPQAEDEKQASIAQQNEKTPPRGYIDALKSFGQRLSDWFQQYQKTPLRGPIDALKSFGQRLSEFFQKLKQ